MHSNPYSEPCPDNVTCNDVYNTYRQDFSDLTRCDELENFLKAKALDHPYLYHFTTMEALANIYREEKWKFSSAFRTNDLQEVSEKGDKRMWERIYSVSFSHGDYNNMGMWRMYGGKCKYESVCLEFSGIAIDTWIKDIENSFLSEQKKMIYSECEINASFHDIAYIHGWQNRGNEIICWGNIVNDKVAKNDVISKYPHLTGYIKNSAWEQEKESRAMILLPLPQKEDFILVPTYSVLESVKVHFSPFVHLCESESINLLRNIFSNLEVPWPNDLEKRCSASYFRSLVR